MKRILRLCRSLLLGILVFGLVGVLSNNAGAQATPTALPTRDQIAKLIKKLGDDSYEVRELAHKTLLRMDDVTPYLKKAIHEFSDSEIAARAKQILQAHAERHADAWLTRLAAHVKRW